MSNFKPMLSCSEEPKIDELSYPLFASIKLDGIRVVFKEGQMFSRNLKKIPNIQLQNKFKLLKDYSLKNNVILDGEIYAIGMSFQRVVHFVMTKDTGLEVVPTDLKFFMFDVLSGDNVDQRFSNRYANYSVIAEQFTDLIFPVEQVLCQSKEEIDSMFERSLEKGFEGLILKAPDSPYKFGRTTYNQGWMYKMKPFISFDAKIIDVTQATKATDDSEVKTNELGYSQRSHKIGDRELIGKAASFTVQYKDKTVNVTIAATDEEKVEIWKKRDQYVDKYIEYKGMLVGSVDVPRHPVFVRFRDDKD